MGIIKKCKHLKPGTEIGRNVYSKTRRY